jgi:transposase
VRAAFPQGHLDVDLRDEVGTRYDDPLLTDLDPPEGRPVEVAPWRLARVVVMQSREGLTDRQAAAAVRRGLDGNSALSRDLHDPGGDCTLWHDGRERVLAHAAAPRLLDPCLTAGNARGWITARGPQRTDSTPVLAAIRPRHRVDGLLDAMQAALNPRSDAAPVWVQPHGPIAWSARSGRRADQTRLPQDTSPREARARPLGADGDQLLAWVLPADSVPGLRTVPALEAWRPIGRQHDDRCTVPGLEDLRWRTTDEQPPAALRMTSPYDLAARDRRQRDPQGVGDQRHLTETWAPEHPDLMTPVLTTLSPTPDCPRGPALVQDWAARDLRPGTHRLDSGYVEADCLVTAPRPHQLDVVGPPCGS